MTIKELIDVIEKLESRNNSYWNFYTVVVVAICGWVFSQQGNPLNPTIVWALIVGNSLFYFMNLSVIYGTTKRLVAFEDELNLRATDEEIKSSQLIKNLSNPFLVKRLPFTIATHLIMDFAVLYFIYFGLMN